MPRLYHTLNVGSESLFNSRAGVDTAGHNIASAHVEGYSRQRVNLENREPLQTKGHLFGNGAHIKSVSRAHDKFVEGQINRANQALGRSHARYEGLSSIEGIFSPELMNNLSQEMGAFFNSLQDLSNFPEDFTVRSNAVEAARNLSSSFQSVDSRLKESRLGLNEQISNTVESINDRLSAMARLNVRIKELEAGGVAQANDLRDQRDALLRDLTEDIEINYYEDQWGMLVVRGPKEVTLVEGPRHASMSVTANRDNKGLYDIIITDWEQSSSRNVTDKINGGRIDGLLQLRDELLPNLIDKNNELTFNFANSVNAVHREGYGIGDFAEAKGRNLFDVSNSIENAAESISITDVLNASPNSLAAGSTPNAPGDNVNMNNLVRLKDMKLMQDGATTFNDYYANMIGQIGLETVRAEHVSDADQILSRDLEAKREAVSGVSLDEEAVELMKWQSAFTASSKVITTVDEMLETVLTLKR